MFLGLPVCWSVLKRMTPPSPRSAMSDRVAPAASIVRPRNPTSSNRAIRVSSGLAGLGGGVGSGDCVGLDDGVGGGVGAADGVGDGATVGVVEAAPQVQSPAANPAEAPACSSRRREI